MKKFLLPVFAMMIAVLSFVACEGPMGPEGPAGENGYGTVQEVYTITVNANEWVEVRDNDPERSNFHYKCEKRLDKLDGDIIDFGAHLAYMYLNPNDIDGGLVSLTDSYPIERFYNDGSYETWTEYYSAIYYPGTVVFTVRYSDFAINQPPPTTKYKVILSVDEYYLN